MSVYISSECLYSLKLNLIAFKINSICNSINSNHNLFNILSNSYTTSNANLNIESDLNPNSNTNVDLNLINDSISKANPNSVLISIFCLINLNIWRKKIILTLTII